MSVLIQRELNQIKRDLLALGTRVEENVHLAVRFFLEREPHLADKVAENEAIIDESEINIEEECLKVLALHHPVAGDLRFIVSILKINSELERIGDLAMSIVKRGVKLPESEDVINQIDFTLIIQKACYMLKASLDSLVNLDTQLARQVVGLDDEVDDLKRSMREEIKVLMMKHPEKINPLLNVMSLVGYLERVGDLATNIAEGIIYMIEGKIVRHRHAKTALQPE